MSGVATSPIVNITIMSPDGTVIAVMSSLAFRNARPLMKLSRTRPYRAAAHLPPPIGYK
jgi:hypothetical protein